MNGVGAGSSPLLRVLGDPPPTPTGAGSSSNSSSDDPSNASNSSNSSSETKKVGPIGGYFRGPYAHGCQPDVAYQPTGGAKGLKVEDFVYNGDADALSLAADMDETRDGGNGLKELCWHRHMNCVERYQSPECPIRQGIISRSRDRFVFPPSPLLEPSDLFFPVSGLLD